MSTVLKFGGTSVEDAPAFARVAEIVGARRDAVPVVVTSAMSRFTDALVGAVQAASNGDPEAALDRLVPHLERHVAAADALLAPAAAAESAEPIRFGCAGPLRERKLKRRPAPHPPAAFRGARANA